MSDDDAVPGLGDRPGASAQEAAAGRRMARICADAVQATGVDGAGITVMGTLDGVRDQVCATGPSSRRLEELQLTAGEGPCVDAYTTGAPVLVADLRAESTRWLGFAPEALAAGTAAVFSLPLQVGAIRLGALDLHRARTGPLAPEQLAGALAVADAATEALLEETGPGVEGDVGWLPGVHAEVHVASGVVAVQAGLDVGAALLRLRGHAYAHGEPLHVVARRVIDHSLVLDDTDATPLETLLPAPDPEDDDR